MLTNIRIEHPLITCMQHKIDVEPRKITAIGFAILSIKKKFIVSFKFITQQLKNFVD